jgi:ribose 1,5-bisphosphokinase PhnN
MKTFTKTSSGFSGAPSESFDAIREVYASIQTHLRKRMVERTAEFAHEKRSSLSLSDFDAANGYNAFVEARRMRLENRRNDAAADPKHPKAA